MDQRARELIDIGNRLYSMRQPWMTLWQRLAEEFYAMRADFISPFTAGEELASYHTEGYPEYARETLAASIQSTLRNGDWFNVKTGFEEIDEQPDNARWLEGATKRFRRLIYDRRANFTRATTECDHDWVAFGNLIMSVEESPDRTHFLFRNWHLRDCVWLENEIGQVDHIHRKMTMTARNIVRRWGDKAPQEIRTVAEREPMKEFECRHIVLPADEFKGGDIKPRRGEQKLPFASVYICPEHDCILSEGGLPAFNYVVGRWRTISHWQYGFSPASIIALPDARMLQSVARVILEAGERAVDPPIVATEEAVRSDLNVFSGGVTWVDSEYDERLGEALRPLAIAGNVGLGMEIKQDVRNLIGEAFLLNKLYIPSEREMTAFETQQRVAEFRRAILPFFNPIESDYHAPMLDIAFSMAVRNRAFDFQEMPDDLQGEDVTFSFESPLNTMEGRAQVAQFQETVQIVAGAAEIDPNATKLVDFQKATKDAIRGTGAPADWMKDDEQLVAEQQADAQVQQVQQAAQLLSGGAEVAGQVADSTLKLQQAGLA